MDWNSLKKSVLQWLNTLKIKESPYRYRLSASTDDSAFTSCFALFILDLFGETEHFSDEKKKGWTAYLNSFQNPQYGYYEPKPYHHFDKERNRYQLTCFCLSALAILEAKPLYELTFMEQYRTPESVERYLYERGCHEGRASSGNKAMFLAIFLTYLYETKKEATYKELIDVWFDFHDRHVNASGFWGHDKSCHSFHGIQNGLHQFIVYWYWRKDLHHSERIIDAALSLQSGDGYFSPTPGGEACHDYDVVHTLVCVSQRNTYRKRAVSEALNKAKHASLANRNNDGGFCQSKKQLVTYLDIIRNMPFIFSGFRPYQSYYRLRRAISIIRYGQFKVRTGWTAKDRTWNESNLWDTWFRTIILADIEKSKTADTIKTDAKYQTFIGLGNDIPKKSATA